MNYIKVNPKKINSAVINLIADSLYLGRVLILPTDTIYGFSCLANMVKPIKKIYRLKKRDSKKPLLVLVDSLRMAGEYVEISPEQRKILKEIWSKNQPPTTVILKNKNKLPKELTRNSDGLAIRLPKSNFLIKIIRKAACPLVSTSLNLSGERTIDDLSKLDYYFPKKNNRPDLIIDAGRTRKRKSSRLIDLRSVEKPVVIRK